MGVVAILHESDSAYILAVICHSCCINCCATLAWILKIMSYCDELLEYLALVGLIADHGSGGLDLLPRENTGRAIPVNSGQAKLASPTNQEFRDKDCSAETISTTRRT